MFFSSLESNGGGRRAPTCPRDEVFVAIAIKELLAVFKLAPWKSPQEVDELVASATPVSMPDQLKVLETLLQKNMGSDMAAHRARCTAFGKLAEAAPDKRLFLPFVKALKASDGTLRQVLLSLMPKVNNIAEHGDVCDLLKSAEQSVRALAAQVLKLVAGKTVFQTLSDLVAIESFPGRIEATDVLAQSAGHYAIPALQSVLAIGKRPEKLHALKYLGDPKYVAKDVPNALKAIAIGLGDEDEEVHSTSISAFSNVCADEDTWFAYIGPFLDAERLTSVKAAILGLKRFRSLRAIAALERKIISGPTQVRLAVLNTLEQIATDDVLSPLVTALSHRSMVVRTRAGAVLSALSRERKVDVSRTVVFLLRSRDVEVRRMAVEVARSVPDPAELWPKLLTFLHDEDWWVRERVMDTLVEMAGTHLTRHLIPYLADPSDVVRRFALDALMRLKDPQSLGALVRTAGNDPDWWAREKAIETIGLIKDLRAVPYLVELIQRFPDLQIACLQALKSMEARSAGPPIASLLTSQDPDIRLCVVQCLAAFNDPALAAAIQPLQADPDGNVRAEARSLLARWQIALSMDTASAADQAGATLDKLLVATARAEADDLIIAPERQPIVKRMGKTSALARNVLSAEQVRALLMPHLSDQQVADLKNLREVDFSYHVRSENLRFRGHVFLTMTGMSAVFRIIKNTLPQFEQLGLPPVVRSLGEIKSGLVLIGGPTGSGKSTTLAALVNDINRSTAKHIVTLEDPIEVVHRREKSLINQREIGVHARSFAYALRATLREDPDVILMGEMRDLPTISFAVTAAETGHLVFGTIHTASADTSIDRLINAFPGTQQDQVRAMLSQSMRAVVCQYLIKRKDAAGRCLAAEVMINNDAVSNLIRKGKTFQIPSIIATSRESGMQLMDTDLMRLFKEGRITAEDAYVRARNKKDFEELVGGTPADAEGVETSDASPARTRATEKPPDSASEPAEPLRARARNHGKA